MKGLAQSHAWGGGGGEEGSMWAARPAATDVAIRGGQAAGGLWLGGFRDFSFIFNWGSDSHTGLVRFLDRCGFSPPRGPRVCVA